MGGLNCASSPGFFFGELYTKPEVYACLISLVTIISSRICPLMDAGMGMGMGMGTGIGQVHGYRRNGGEIL